MKSDEEIMEILEAFDLTRSFRDAGELAGCSPNTVAHWVAARDDATLQSPARREPGPGGEAGDGAEEADPVGPAAAGARRSEAFDAPSLPASHQAHGGAAQG